MKKFEIAVLIIAFIALLTSVPSLFGEQVSPSGTAAKEAVFADMTPSPADEMSTIPVHVGVLPGPAYIVICKFGYRFDARYGCGEDLLKQRPTGLFSNLVVFRFDSFGDPVPTTQLLFRELPKPTRFPSPIAPNLL